MKTLLLSLLSYFVALSLLEAMAFSQTPTPSTSPKHTTATCGKAVCTWNAFGPITYSRDAGQPQTVSNTFSVLNPSTQFTLHIDNNGVSSAVISVNGTQVFGPSDFNPNVTTLDRPVALASSNNLQVQLRGKPGTSLAVTVIGVDNDPPSIVESETPAANSFGWNNTNVNVSFACSDATSGVASCPASQLLTTEGLNQVIAGTAFDLAGNSATASIQVSIDKTPPAILPSQNPPVNSFSWNNTPVTVSFLCNDNLSGVQICTPPVLVSTEGQNQTIIGMAMDFAGNSATASIAVSIDLTPPTIMATSSPAPNANGWNNTPVTVTFSCADALSGVASCPQTQTVSSEGENQGISGTTFDKAGNSASASVSLNIDEIPPVITISSPATGSTVTSASLQVTGTVSDNLSGVALVTCDGAAAIISTVTFSCNVTLVAGANTVQVQAADRAGNTASWQIPVTFNATPPPPPKSLLITPSLVNMLVGDTRPVALIGDIGHAVRGTTWSISDPTVVSITSADPPHLTALAQGTATLTATFNGLTAAMTINVLPGATLPPGTPLWAFDPLPGNTITEMVPGNPVSPGDPDLYSVESPDTLRSFTKDGIELWAVSPGTAPSSPASSTTLSVIQLQSAFSAVSQSRESVPSFSLSSIPPSAQELLRRHGAFDSLDVLARQKRFIEQHRRRSSATDATRDLLPATPLSSSPAFASNATTASTTLLIKAVADNGGGIINLLETFTGCCQITQASLIKIDNATQQQVWRHDFPSAIDENFAIGDDNTIYSSQLIFPTVSNIFDPFGSATGSVIFAIDGTTGQQKFSLPLPSGHFKLADTESNSRLIVLADVDVAAQPGPLSILPDGSINAVVSTVHLEEDFHGIFGAGFSETAVSDHKTLQLLTIQPDGSFANQSIQAFDFDKTGCQTTCNDPNEGYVPNEVVPDGAGGLLATWTGGDSQLGITNGSKALVRHFDNAGGTLDYVVPFSGSSWFRVGNNNPHGLVVGGNSVAFGSDGQSIIAFDVNAGSQLWTFQAPSFQGTSLLAPAAGGGVAAVQLADFDGAFDSTPIALLSFDPTGIVSTTPFLGSSSNVSYFDNNILLAVAGMGQGAMLPAAAAFDPNGIWQHKGDQSNARKPVAFEISKVARNRAMVGTTTNLFVRGTQFGQSPKLVFGDPANPNTDLTVSNVQYDSSTGVITADIAVAPKAAGGKVLIFVQNGAKETKKNNKAFFFVQIPTTLVRDASFGQGGLSNVVTVNNGDVVDIFGNIRRQHRCGVYRNIAYILHDQEGRPIEADYDLHESFQNYNASTPALTPLPDEDNPTAAAQKNLGDTQFLGTAFPACPGPNDHESFDQHLSVIVGTSDNTATYPLTIVNHIARGFFNGTATVDVTITTP